jgi:hypothetical protein
MSYLRGPADFLHGDEDLVELEDWEWRERFFDTLRELKDAANYVELKSDTKWIPYPEDIEALQDMLEELKYALKR